MYGEKSTMTRIILVLSWRSSASVYVAYSSQKQITPEYFVLVTQARYFFEFYLQVKVWDNATICLWWWGLLSLFHLVPFYNAGFKLWMADVILIGILSLQSKDTGLVITYFLYFLSYTCVMRLCISVLFYLFLKLNLDLIYVNYHYFLNWHFLNCFKELFRFNQCCLDWLEIEIFFRFTSGYSLAWGKFLGYSPKSYK